MSIIVIIIYKIIIIGIINIKIVIMMKIAIIISIIIIITVIMMIIIMIIMMIMTATENQPFSPQPDEASMNASKEGITPHPTHDFSKFAAMKFELRPNEVFSSVYSALDALEKDFPTLMVATKVTAESTFILTPKNESNARYLSYIILLHPTRLQLYNTFSQRKL